MIVRAGVVAAIACAVMALTACGGGGNRRQPRIVYEAADADGRVSVYTLDAASGESERLTDGASFDGNPGWSPDHRRVVFVSDRVRGKRQNDVYTMNADGSDVQRVTTGRIESYWSPKFSPDGRQIAFSLLQQGEYFIGVMRADGQLGRPLAGPYQFAEFPSWTADGGEIYFSAIGKGTQAADIFAVDVATAVIRTVIATPGPDVCPHFTRDGAFLSYASSPHDNPEGEEDIFLHDLSSGDTSGAADVPLTTDPTRDDYANPSPDGRQWVYLSDRDGNAELYLMRRDGTKPRRLTTTPDVRENVPDW